MMFSAARRVAGRPISVQTTVGPGWCSFHPYRCECFL